MIVRVTISNTTAADMAERLREAGWPGTVWDVRGVEVGKQVEPGVTFEVALDLGRLAYGVTERLYAWIGEELRLLGEESAYVVLHGFLGSRAFVLSVVRPSSWDGTWGYVLEAIG